MYKLTEGDNKLLRQHVLVGHISSLWGTDMLSGEAILSKFCLPPF